MEKAKAKHLLSHRSGTPDERGHLTREQKTYGDDNLASEHSSTSHHSDFEPGKHYEHENPTYVI